ncbi:uncharacterized protein LOC132193383 [Neocloeon triangulifer]|uniref:uncharacterized protein LOC132193383 n=1 Tax=Neocloeon triangulifer TaxID=2078957 RepID=UPI00286F7EBA|nr:uncharacterized protein LOC132193383 [Neocloeon triangulifer]
MNKLILSLICFIFTFNNSANGQDEQPTPPTTFWKPVSQTVVAAVTREEIDGYDINFDTSYTPEQLFEYEFSTSFGLELWSFVWDKLKLTVRFITPQGVSANSASALPQLVYQGGANFALVPTVFGPEETKGLVITQPTHSTRFKLFIQSPTSVSTSLSLGKVFSPVLWLAIVISMLMMGVILIFIEFVGQKAKIRSYLATPADVGQLIIIVIGCFCYQGAIQIASGCSGRVLVWTSLICGYLIYITYNTEVISQLTTVSFKPPFDSLQDMAAKKTHKLIVRNDTSLLDNIKITRLKDGKRGPLADVWDQLLPMKPKADNLYNNKSEIKRLCKENVAFLDSELAIPPKDQQISKCNVMTLKDSYFRSNLGFVLNQNNTYNRQIIKMFNRMRETGIINRMRRYIDQPDVGPLKPLPDLNPIDIDTLIPMLVVLYMGMAASIITLGLEIAFKRGGGELIKRMNERGFYTWKDLICFWKVRKPEPAEEEESSSDEDSDTDVEQPPQQKTAPTIKISTTPQQPIKVRSTNEKPSSLNKYPVKAEFIKNGANDEKKSNLINKDNFVPPEFRLNDGKDFLRNYINENQNKPRPFRRQNRISDLTSMLPKTVTASSNPQYLDKNIVGGHDSSQESNNFESPRPDRRSPAPARSSAANIELKPEKIPEKPVLYVNIPRGQISNQILQTEKDPPANNQKPKPESNPTLPVRRTRFSLPEPAKAPTTPIKSFPPTPHYNPEDLAKPIKLSREELLKKQTPPEPLQIPRRRESRPKSEGQERNRAQIPPTQETVDLFPINLNQILAGRQNAAPPNQNVPNLHLSLDTNGFLDRHTIIDMNLARRMRQNRDPDPFSGLE